MRTSIKYLFFLCLFLAVSAVAARADVKLPAVIADGMVLQQGIDVPVWGWADDGESVSVEILKQKVTAVAVGGKWMVKLKPLKAGGPFEMVIAGKNKIEFKNVLVGEVWICSGQSNMQWSLRQSDNGDAEIAKANYSMIRLFTIPRQEKEEPQTEISASWKECSPDTVGGFPRLGIISAAIFTGPKMCRSV